MALARPAAADEASSVTPPLAPLSGPAVEPANPSAEAPLPNLPETTRLGETSLPKAKPVKKSRPRLKASALPPLRPYHGAERLGLRGGATDPTVDAAGLPITYDPPPPAVAATPNPAERPERRKIPADDNPFEPLGLRLGGITLKPYVEEDAGYATNPLGQESGAKGSWFDTTEAGLSWQSDWNRNDFHGQLKSGYTDYFTAPEASSPYGSGTVDARVDATRDLAFDAEGRFNITSESLSSFGLTSSQGTNPYVAVTTYGGTVGASNKLGQLTFALHGSYDREAYPDIALFGAGSTPLSADDYNDYGLKLRTSYRLSEAVSPWVEFAYDVRLYDGATDALGYLRDSTGYAGKAGVTLDISKVLTGEASFGYGERNYQDPRLERAAAPLVDASLIWSPTALTTVTLKAASALNDTVLAGASADLNRTFSIDIAHAFTRAVTLGFTGTYAIDQYIGASTRDVSTTLAGRAEYHLNRNVVLKASASHQIYSSNQVGSSYVSDVFMLGVRLQD
jgi:hypothetical protein